MPHFFVRQSPRIAAMVPKDCHPELLFVVQDAISLVLDCPMVRVTYSTDLTVDEAMIDHDLVIRISATTQMWDRLWGTRINVIEAVKNTLVRKLGVINESRILVKTTISSFAAQSRR